ncbi:MAG: HDIG domain-containing protein [Desulfobulbaceae bacterium]|nr:HDIG domain-containing protein [Desulfobulbaceae bacterium]MCK5323095.1 HDIG domain-containing protein [Desulfobulbaceae bacterium]MCK5545149.1 HDIG domain-containing protein [Desulfobulbaceae bacterium]
MIPSVEECFRIMDQYRMLENIRAHTIVVAGIAELIGRRLRDAGMNISIEVVVAGAMMHDIGKTPCLNTRERHDLKGKEICLKHGFHEIAAIVGEHVILKNGGPFTDLTEKELVFYADKRVNHDKIVSLEERMAYVLERYGRNDDYFLHLIRKNFEVCQVIENRVFEHLDQTPNDLAEMVAQFPSLTFS